MNELVLLEKTELEELADDVISKLDADIENSSYLIALEKERYSNAKKGKQEDKLFIYEKIKRILEHDFKKIVKNETIDKLIKQYHVNYYENLYFDKAVDKDENFDDFNTDLLDDAVDPTQLEIFKFFKTRLIHKPSLDTDIIEYFEQFKLQEDTPYYIKLDRLARIIYQSKKGFGVIEDLIDDSQIFNDIGCNSWDKIWFQFKGKKRFLNKVKFASHKDYQRVYCNIVNYNGAGDPSPSNPKLECSIMDMQRVTLLVPNIVRDGCEVLRIRNQALPYISLEQLVINQSISMSFYKFIHLTRPGRLNIVAFGGQGVGKSTFVNSLIEATRFDEVQVTQESQHELFADLRYKNKNIVGLQNSEFFKPGDVYTTKLRLCIDRDHYGEVRTAEDAYWAKQTMTRQCRGSYSTVHFTFPQDVIEGWAELVCQYLKFADFKTMRYSIARMINLLVEPWRDNETGKYYIKNVYEVFVTDADKMHYDIKKIFAYDDCKKELLPVSKLTDYTKNLCKNFGVTDTDLKEIDLIMEGK